MFRDSKRKIGLHRVACAGVLCTGACLVWWLASSAAIARGSQDGSAITVNGQAPEKHETPFACSIEKSLTKEQRAHKKEIAVKMESARIATQEIADGYVFRFRPEAISFAEIADWVSTERVCCPFFDLAIEAGRENGPLSLRITGREGVKQFIRGEFQTLKLR
jgi:hypothetical protein